MYISFVSPIRKKKKHTTIPWVQQYKSQDFALEIHTMKSPWILKTKTIVIKASLQAHNGQSKIIYGKQSINSKILYLIHRSQNIKQLSTVFSLS